MVHQFTIVETFSFPLHPFLWERVLLGLKQWESSAEYETYLRSKLKSVGLDVALGPTGKIKGLYCLKARELKSQENPNFLPLVNSVHYLYIDFSGS